MGVHEPRDQHPALRVEYAVCVGRFPTAHHGHDQAVLHKDRPIGKPGTGADIDYVRMHDGQIDRVRTLGPGARRKG